MISVIYGPKGSGKTKKLIDQANATVESAKGNVVYVTNKGKHSLQVSNSIRFIDSEEYNISGISQALGFIKGILAADNDITAVFLDGLRTIAGVEEVTDLKDFFDALEKLLEGRTETQFIVTISADTLPEFLKKYA